MLQLLLEADGGTVSAEELLERAWDANADPSPGSQLSFEQGRPHPGAVRVCMSKLRAKLGEPALIRTVQGVGYAL